MKPDKNTKSPAARSTKKAAIDPKIDTTAPKTRPANKERPKVAADDAGLTVADLARNMGISPKVARAKLRRQGYSADGGQYPRMTPGTKEYDAVVNILTPGAKA